VEAHVKAIDSETLRERVTAVSVLVLALVDGLMLRWLIDPDAMPIGQALLEAVIAAVGSLVAPHTEAPGRRSIESGLEGA
jgi:hypothetical protein